MYFCCVRTLLGIRDHTSCFVSCLQIVRDIGQVLS